MTLTRLTPFSRKTATQSMNCKLVVTQPTLNEARRANLNANKRILKWCYSAITFFQQFQLSLAELAAKGPKGNMGSGKSSILAAILWLAVS